MDSASSSNPLLPPPPPPPPLLPPAISAATLPVSGGWWWHQLYSSWTRALVQRQQSIPVELMNGVSNLPTAFGTSSLKNDSSTGTRSTISDFSLRSSSPEQLDSLVTHGATESTPYKCSYCPRSYPRLTLMKLHEQTHTEHLPFECEYCRHRFKHKRSKDRHVKLHTGEKKFKCKLCPSAYCRSDHLKIHLRSHDKKKPHQCRICSRGYRTVAALTSHQQRHGHHHVSVTAETSAWSSNELEVSHEQSTKVSDKRAREEATEIQIKTEKELDKKTQSATINETRTTEDKDEEQAEEALNLTFAKTPNGEMQHQRRANIQKPPLRQVRQEKENPNSMRHDLPSGDQYFTSTHTGAQHMTDWEHLWSCPYCDRPTRFSNMEALSYHIQTFHVISTGVDQTPLNALSANHNNNIVTTSNSDMKQFKSMHYTASTSDASAICIICQAELPNMLALVAHIQTVHTVSPVLPNSQTPKRTAEGLVKNSMSRAEWGRALFSITPQSVGKDSGGGIDNAHLRACSEGGREAAASSLICSTCGQRFDEFELYRVHFQQHHLDKHTAVQMAPQSHYVTCCHCHRLFTCSEQLRQHVDSEVRSETVRHMCRTCPVGYASGAELRQHNQDTHVQRVYRCGICLSVFDSSVEVQDHVSAEHCEQKRVMKCGACDVPDRDFDDETAFWRHFTECHAKLDPLSPVNTMASTNRIFTEELHRKTSRHFSALRCPLCEQKFHVEFQLEKHLQSHHNVLSSSANDIGALSNSPSNSASRLSPVLPAVRHKCNICDELLASAESLARHKLMHCKVVHADTCATCKQRVPSVAEYRRHVFQHSCGTSGASGNFPVSCAICQQTLASESELQLHAEFHLQSIEGASGVHREANNKNTASAPVNDERHIVGENTATSSYYRHQMAKSPIASETSCSICHAQLSSRQELRLHLVEHSFEGCASYSCYICSAVFTTASALCRHMPAHGQQARPFDCSACSERFFFRAELQHHIALQHRHLLTPCVTISVNSHRQSDRASHDRASSVEDTVSHQPELKSDFHFAEEPGNTAAQISASEPLSQNADSSISLDGTQSSSNSVSAASCEECTPKSQQFDDECSVE